MKQRISIPSFARKRMFRMLLPTLLFATLTGRAATPQYVKRDSAQVVQWLVEAQGDAHLRSSSASGRLMLHFARKFLGTPYVGGTLERNSTEQLVVNLQELDCTTFVETVLALTLCARNGKTTFADFYRFLQLVRYRNGEVAYPARLHYFSEWIADNTAMGYVGEVKWKQKPFTAVQTLRIDYMSRHPELYPMLRAHPAWVQPIRAMEERLSGLQVRYIPKHEIGNTPVCRRAIADGDILAIVTSRAGLDTSHIGIAVWKADGLHLFHASSLRHRVVEDRPTLRAYMNRQPSQLGIRVVRVK